MKKAFIVILILVVAAALAAAGVTVYNKATEKAAAYMIKTISESLTEQEFENLLKTYAQTVVENPDVNEQTRESAEKVLEGAEDAPKKNELDLAAIEKKLTPEDKAFVMDIYKRFSASEITDATALVKDGITPEEKQTLKEMLKAKLVAGEKEKVVNMYSKYIINE